MYILQIRTNGHIIIGEVLKTALRHLRISHSVLVYNERAGGKKKMLKEFVEKRHCKFAESAKDWKDAIRMSCEVLEADGTVEGNYKEDIIKCVEQYGPYIVIMPGVAMPHSQECARGVHKTAIAFMKLEKPVSFAQNAPDKDAVLFFTLASCNPDQHLENMAKLAGILSNEELVEELKKARCPEDLIALQEKYL